MMPILLGIVLRFANFFVEKSYWGDERWSIGNADQSFVATLLGAIWDVHPPLYQCLLHFSVGSPRLISLLAGIGSLILIYLVAKDLFGREAAQVVGLLAALSPYALHSGNEVRGYALSGFLCLASFWAFSNGRKWWWVPLVLALWTEWYAWMYLAALLVIVGCEVGVIYAIAAGLPMIALGMFQAVGTEHVLDISRVSEYWRWDWMAKKLVGVVWHWQNGYVYSMLEWGTIVGYLKNGNFLFAITGLSTLTSLGAFGYGLSRRGIPRKLRLFFLTVCVVPVLALGTLYPIRLDARYLSFAWPFYILLVGYGVSQLRGLLKGTVLGLLLFVSAYGALTTILTLYDLCHREDWASARKWVLEDMRNEPVSTNYVYRVVNMNQSVRDRQIAEEKPTEARRFPEDGLLAVYKFRRDK